MQLHIRVADKKYGSDNNVKLKQSYVEPAALLITFMIMIIKFKF